jgi:high-affinity iron transporter
VKTLPGPILRVVAVLIGVGALMSIAAPSMASAKADEPGSRSQAIEQLTQVRESIGQTLTLIKQGRAEEAFEIARSGYLNHFEDVEIPLRVIDPGYTSDVETQFAVIRNSIRDHDPVDQTRDEIVQLRGMIDQVERKLSNPGISGPAVIFGQSFLIIFREGLEAVLLISILLSYLEQAKAGRYRRPILLGMGAAAVGSGLTFLLLRGVISAIPLGREILEGVTALVAVAMLFWVSFWLVARLEQKRWLEFLRARVWKAVSVGSTTALVMVGFTSVYREGFETALFYQALSSFGTGMAGWIVAGLVAGLGVLAVCAYFILQLGRKLPVKAFLSTAVVLLMATSVTLLGNAVRALQEADVVPLHRWTDWPSMHIFAAQSLGYWPSRETILAQLALTLVYVAGAVWVFVIQPRRNSAVTAVAGRAE